MKRFVGEIKIEDPTLVCDIVQALEKDPDSGRTYEVELYDNHSVCDPLRGRDPSEQYCARLKIFTLE